MDNILVLAYAEEDRDYVADFAETLIDAGKNIVLDQYDLSALRLGPPHPPIFQVGVRRPQQALPKRLEHLL
jgi:hypothetical protein